MDWHGHGEKTNTRSFLVQRIKSVYREFDLNQMNFPIEFFCAVAAAAVAANDSNTHRLTQYICIFVSNFVFHSVVLSVKQ